MQFWETRGRHNLCVKMTHTAIIQRESDANVMKDLVWVGLALALVAGFSHIVFFRNSWIHCNVHLVYIALFSSKILISSILHILNCNMPIGVQIHNKS